MEGELSIKELVLDHISLESDSEVILQNINISINRGGSLSLLGPSGCGKTTLLRIIAGLERPDSGKILFRGKEIVDLAPHRRNFGMMFQDYALFPHRNVYENISFGLEMKKVAKKDIASRVDEMLELVNLQREAKRDIRELSGGERQRVALARTLAPSPDLIMLDEPLGALDRRLRERLLSDLCIILKRTGITTIWVTHDQSEAFAASDLVCVMNSGRVEQIASPENLYHNPVNRTVADFLGFQNIIDGEIAGAGDGQLLIMPDAATVISENSAFSLQDSNLDFYPPLTGATEDESAEMQDLTSLMDSQLCVPPNLHIKESDIISGIVTETFFQGAIRRVSIKASVEKIIKSSMPEHTLFFDIQGQTPIPEVGEPIFLRINPAGIKILNRSS